MTTSNNRDRDRFRWLGRLLEMVPGTISWAVLILPLWLSFSYPWLVAYFVLSFDFYWLCRALWFSGAVIVAYRRIRRVLDVDWGARLAALGDIGARERPSRLSWRHGQAAHRRARLRRAAGAGREGARRIRARAGRPRCGGRAA